MIKHVDSHGIGLIKKFEGCRLLAYRCPAGIWTIGFGNTYYANGKRVQQGDRITAAQADELLLKTLRTYEQAVMNLTRDDINQNQFNALVSFAFNCGIRALQDSTLLKMVNKSPESPMIKHEFAKWKRANGIVLPGLVARRAEEARMYFTK